MHYNVALRGVKRSVHGGASRSEPFDNFDHAREEARMAEELAGESRKMADGARDFLQQSTRGGERRPRGTAAPPERRETVPQGGGSIPPPLGAASRTDEQHRETLVEAC